MIFYSRQRQIYLRFTQLAVSHWWRTLKRNDILDKWIFHTNCLFLLFFTVLRIHFFFVVIINCLVHTYFWSIKANRLLNSLEIAKTFFFLSFLLSLSKNPQTKLIFFCNLVFRIGQFFYMKIIFQSKAARALIS